MNVYTPVELRQIVSFPFFADLVQCGFPSPAQDYVEKRIDLNELLVQRARDVAQYLIELYLRFPPDRETGLALRRYDEMLCQTYPHIAAMMTNKNTRLLRAGRYLPYRTLSAWARGKQSNGGIL